MKTFLMSLFILSLLLLLSSTNNEKKNELYVSLYLDITANQLRDVFIFFYLANTILCPFLIDREEIDRTQKLSSSLYCIQQHAI